MGLKFPWEELVSRTEDPRYLEQRWVIGRSLVWWLRRSFAFNLSDARSPIYKTRAVAEPLPLEDRGRLTYDVKGALHHHFIWNDGLDLRGAVGSVMPMSFCPWPTGASDELTNCWLRIYRLVRDVSIGNTQIAMGPDLTVAASYPVTLHDALGAAIQCELWIPPGWYLGLVTSNNAADSAVSLTVWGEVVPGGPGGLVAATGMYGGSLP